MVVPSGGDHQARRGVTALKRLGSGDVALGTHREHHCNIDVNPFARVTTPR
jgi:hypothetical protein